MAYTLCTDMRCKKGHKWGWSSEKGGDEEVKPRDSKLQMHCRCTLDNALRGRPGPAKEVPLTKGAASVCPGCSHGCTPFSTAAGVHAGSWHTLGARAFLFSLVSSVPFQCLTGSHLARELRNTV